MQITIIIVLGLIVAAYVLIPLTRNRAVVTYDWDGSEAGLRRAERREAIEAEVQVYRAAMRAGTLCPRCGNANAAGSRFCADCGRKLPGPSPEEAEPEPVSG